MLKYLISSEYVTLFPIFKRYRWDKPLIDRERSENYINKILLKSDSAFRTLPISYTSADKRLCKIRGKHMENHHIKCYYVEELAGSLHQGALMFDRIKQIKQNSKREDKQ